MDAIEIWLSDTRNLIWAAQLFLFVLLTLLLDILEARFYKSTLERLRKTKSVWDDALLESIHHPIKWLIWILGISLVAETIGSVAASPEQMEWIATARRLGVVWLALWFLFRFSHQLEKNFSTPREGRKVFPEASTKAMGRLGRLILGFIGVLVAMDTFGVNITGILTFGSVGTLVIGFAGQNVLSNFFGGLMLYTDRPFQVGDWIQSPDRDIEGVVEEIGWRLTRIRTFRRRPLYVPNSTFMSISVENPSRMSNRRIKETIGVRYDDAHRLPALLADLKELIAKHPDLDQRVAHMVHFVHFGASSLDINLYCFTKTVDWRTYRDVQEQVFMEILAVIEKHGAEVAFPTQTLHVPDGFALQAEPAIEA